MLGVQELQEVKARGCGNKVLLQTYGNSESGDHIKNDENNKWSGDNNVQAVQELQGNVCVNKEDIEVDVNSGMEDQEITEKDSMKQEKSGLLCKRTRCQLLKRNKNFL